MANYRTSDQAKAEYVSAMGDDLGATYHMLWQHCAWLHTKWDDYVSLFGTTEERFDLVMSAAPKFFHNVEIAMWENVLLHIAKLTDPAASRIPKNRGGGEKPNLSIKRLVLLIQDVTLQGKVRTKVDAAIDACEFARDWRNRHVAHLDLDHALDSTAKPLAPASRLKVKAALAALDAVLNEVSQHYLDSTSFFDTGSEDAENLLYVIHDGLAANRARQERLRSGKYTQDDVKRPTL